MPPSFPPWTCAGSRTCTSGNSFHARVNLVEIDLLPGGPRLPLEDLPACDYYAMVARPEDHPQAAVWPVRLRDQLPTIPIPLRPPNEVGDGMDR